MVTIAHHLNVLTAVLRLFQTAAVTSMVHSFTTLELLVMGWTVLRMRAAGYYLAQCAQNKHLLANIMRYARPTMHLHIIIELLRIQYMQTELVTLKSSLYIMLIKIIINFHDKCTKTQWISLTKSMHVGTGACSWMHIASNNQLVCTCICVKEIIQYMHVHGFGIYSQLMMSCMLICNYYIRQHM